MSQEEIRDWVSRCYDEFCSPGFRAKDELERLTPVRQHWQEAADNVQRHLPLVEARP